VFCILSTGPAAAQDAHYWTRQYGPTETLLGGLVVGSAYDLSATFYNPGDLALAEDPRFTFSLDALEISLIRIPNGAGPGLDFQSKGLEFSPSFVSGLIGSGKRRRIAFAVLTRQDLRFRMGARRDFTNTSTGRTFSGAARLDQDAKEYWAGGTWSTLLRDRIGFGISQFFAQRSQKTFNQLTADIATADEAGSSAQITDEYSYRHLRTLWKIGVSYRRSEHLSLGAAMTTPSLGLFGTGKVDVQAAAIGVDLDGDTLPESELLGRLQKDLKASYKSPLSVALGLRYLWRKTAIHLTAEWFDSVDPFDVMEAEPIESRPTGDFVFDPTVTHSLRSIFNFGAGIQHRFSERVTAYGAVMKDASAAIRDPELNHSFATWNLVHLTAGVRVGEPERAWTIGIGYAFGDDSYARLIDLSESGPVPGLDETPNQVEAFFSRWKIIFGFKLGSK
jgi:hypothetical protein